VAEQIHVFSAHESSDFHGVIRNPTATAVKPNLIIYGPADDEIFVWSALGLKFYIFNLSNAKAIEIANPKYYHSSTASRGYSIRRDSGHLALITRTNGKDIITVHEPNSRTVSRSWNPATIDAQGLVWTPDSSWILVWESAAHGHRLLFYTPDGQLFRTWTVPTESDPNSMEYTLAAGLRSCQPSPDGKQIIAFDHSRSIYILNAMTGSTTMSLQHPATIAPKDTLQVRLS
jgi:hypothetical protein